MVAAMVFGFLYSRARVSKEEPMAKLSVLPPANATLDSDYAPLISPDGTKLAFLARDNTGKILLWIRPIDSLNAEPLAGTEGARSPLVGRRAVRRFSKRTVRAKTCRSWWPSARRVV